MRTYLIILLTAYVNAVSWAQQTKTITAYNTVTETLHDVYIAMPDYRQINSGTKFVVTYVGEWPAEMRGAFEHAVRLWEEVLPLSLPISIVAKVGNYRSLGDNLSMVNYTYSDFNGRFVNTFSCPISMVKGVCLQEYHSTNRNRFYNEISDTTMFNQPNDITITYNINKIDQFDFSLDGNPGIDKYDFVTFALRDIAIGLGFNSRLLRDPDQEMLLLTDSRPLPFEKKILPKLSTNPFNIDPYEAYKKGTTGSLNLDVQGLKLYAPSPWINSVSLNTFIPSNHPLSRLLCHDFGKGYVMRNLSGCDWNELFYNLLEWQFEIPVSSNTVVGSFSTTGTSQEIIPFKGVMNIDFNETTTHSTTTHQENDPFSLAIQSENQFDEYDDFYEVIDPFCQKYNLFSPAGPAMNAISLSVLKKDGTWDDIWGTSIEALPVKIEIDKLPLHFDEDEYARGTTGGLRYRLTKCRVIGINKYDGDKYVYSYTTKYFTRDYRPQRALIKYTNSLSKSITLTSEISTLESDDYFIDVPIGIANIEGTKKIIVEQLDEGETLPFQYEVDEEEFRKGYFIANLDRECSTQLTVISYNDNGYQRSNTITIPAIGYNDENLSFSFFSGRIRISGLNENAMSRGEYSYKIHNSGNPVVEMPKKLMTPFILTNKCKSGLNILIVFKKNQIIGTFKFQV